MFQQDPSLQETLASENVRVTPEELTQAMAALEAKKADEARRTTDTVTIGEAVNSLCLDATSDELWDEIQRQRNIRLAEPEEDELQPVINLYNLPRTKFPSEAEVFKPLVIGMVLIVAAFIALCVLFSGASQDGTPLQWSTPVVPTSPDPDISNQSVLVTDITSQGSVTLPLSAVPDNHSVFCSYDRASTITPGFLAAPGTFWNHGSNVWKIVKRHGRVYLQGWARNKRSFASLETTAFDLANKPTAPGLGHRPILLSLPLGQFHSDMSEESISDYEKILVSEAHPDNYAWDAR